MNDSDFAAIAVIGILVFLLWVVLSRVMNYAEDEWSE